MAKKETLDWDVIRRRIAGELSEAEEHRLQEWMQQDVKRQKLVARAEKYYASDELPEIGEERINAAWEKFREAHRIPVKSIRLRLFHWGVAACLLLAFGSGGWLTYKNIYTKQPATQVAEAILPGSSKAYLILSDGKTIELQGKHEFTDRKVNIRLDSLGITYQSADKPGTIAYNTLRIPQGGEYNLTMSDGTRVWLNSKTDLVYPVTFAGNERRVKLSGEAYFEVTHDTEKPFIVETGQMEVKVLGTSFNVNSYQDEPKVVTTLVTGHVQIQSPGQALKFLNPSEQSVYNRKSGQLLVHPVNTSTYTQWREGKFVFRDDDLESVMRILARWYDMEYEFSLPELKTEKFYGMLGRYSNVRQLLEQFEKTGKVHFVFEGKKVIIRK